MPEYLLIFSVTKVLWWLILLLICIVHIVVGTVLNYQSCFSSVHQIQEIVESQSILPSNLSQKKSIFSVSKNKVQYENIHKIEYEDEESESITLQQNIKYFANTYVRNQLNINLFLKKSDKKYFLIHSFIQLFVIFCFVIYDGYYADENADGRINRYGQNGSLKNMIFNIFIIYSFICFYQIFIGSYLVTFKKPKLKKISIFIFLGYILLHVLFVEIDGEFTDVMHMDGVQWIFCISVELGVFLMLYVLEKIRFRWYGRKIGRKSQISSMIGYGGYQMKDNRVISYATVHPAVLSTASVELNGNDDDEHNVDMPSLV